MEEDSSSTEFKCFECASEDLVLDNSSGEYICRSCLRVQPEQVIDTRAEWRIYENDDKGNGESRIRAERVDEEFYSLVDQIAIPTLTSQISENSRDLERASRRSRAMMLKENKAEKYLKDAYTKINDLADKLELPQTIVTVAKDFLRKFEKSKGLKHYRKENFLVAALLIACKQEQGGPLALKGIEKSLPGICEKEVKRFYKLLLTDTSVVNTSLLKPNALHVQQLVANFSTDLGLSFQLTKEAKLVAEKSIEFLEGKKPSSVAAASIWFLLHLWRTTTHKQSDLATVAGISCNTLRNVCREITDHAGQLPPHLFTKCMIPVIDLSSIPDTILFASSSSSAFSTSSSQYEDSKTIISSSSNSSSCASSSQFLPSKKLKLIKQEES